MSSGASDITSKIPRTVLALYNPPPVISGESENEFFRLVDAMAAEYAPTGITQWLWLMRRVTSEWEQARLLRLKSGLIARALRARRREIRDRALQAAVTRACPGSHNALLFVNVEGPTNIDELSEKDRKALNKKLTQITDEAERAENAVPSLDQVHPVFLESLNIYERIDDRLKLNDAATLVLARNRDLFWFVTDKARKPDPPVINCKPNRKARD